MVVVIVGRVMTYWSSRGYSTSWDLDWTQARNKKDGKIGDGRRKTALPLVQLQRIATVTSNALDGPGLQ